jgi:hypothetical protein
VEDVGVRQDKFMVTPEIEERVSPFQFNLVFQFIQAASVQPDWT